MNRRKQAAAAGLTAVMLLSCLPMAGAAPADQALTRGDTAGILLEAAKDYHTDVIYQDILKGYPGGDLKEDQPVTRAEALVMLQRAFDGLPTPVGDNARSGYPAENFTDVPVWAQTELAPVLASGIVAGTSPNTFSPNDPITGKQLDLFLQRTYALEGSNLKDDFYATVNKQALDASVLLPGQLGTGSMYTVTNQVNTELAALIQEVVAGETKTEGEEKMANLYHSVLDIEARDQAGITPIRPYLDAIDQAQTLEELMQVQNTIFAETGTFLLLGFALALDAKDSTSYTLYFDGASPSLGQSGYASATPQQKQAYLTYVSTLLSLVGQEEADAGAQEVWQVDAKLAAASLTNQELGDVDKIYNLYTMDQIQAMFPAQVDLRALFQTTGLKQTDKILVTDPGRLQAWAEIFDESKTPDSLNLLKTYCRLSLAATFGGTLNSEFTQAGNAFNEAYLGTSGAAPLETTATQYIQSYMVDYLGQAYVDRYFSPEAKKDVEKMVDDILAVYRERIESLDWMSQTTKKKAVQKLDALQVNVGYPDQWEDPLAGVDILAPEQGGSLYGNLVAISRAALDKLPALQEEGVQENLWVMTPYSVNANYLANQNSITLPAGILQAPFYDVNASYEENLGGIGYVVAHEITHAFDNNGAKFDEKGNATDWWTAEDYAAFQALCQDVVELYDGRESAPGITCNGALTLSENIADLGSVACLTEIAGRQKDPDFATLYTTMAETWCISYPRETRLYLAQNDLHAPDKLRGSLVLQNFDQFYTAFDIDQDDAMWLAPEDRVTIW